MGGWLVDGQGPEEELSQNGAGIEGGAVGVWGGGLGGLVGLSGM